MSSTFVPTTFFSEEKSNVYPVTIGGSTLFGNNKYLSHSFNNSGNKKTWTFSVWLKKGYQSTISYPTLFFCHSGLGNDYLAIHDVYTSYAYTIERSFYRYSDSTSFDLRTTALYRDYAGWYHFMYVRDTTQATASDRECFYINGELITSFSTAEYLDQNYEAVLNSEFIHNIGAGISPANDYYGGYMADLHLIDGYALEPEDFATTKNGIWVPKEYQGSYGTNGFYLTFRDPSDIGKDYSGNGSDWTVNNLTASNVVKDSPTNNYAVLNPLPNNDYSPLTLSEGNLTATTDGTAIHIQFSTIAFPTSGKWYLEAKFAGGSGGTNVAIALADSKAVTKSVDSYYRTYRNDGQFYDGTSYGNYGSSYAVNDVIGMAFDADNGDLVFYKNGVSQGTACSGIAFDESIALVWEQGGSYKWEVNFGQRSWAYEPPSGYKALSSKNIPDDNQPVKEESQLVTGNNYSFFDHEIQRSCFGNGGSTNNFRLSRTPTTTGNRKTWTFSAWVRQVDFGTETKCCVFSTGVGTANNFLLGLLASTWNWYAHNENGGSKSLRIEPIIGVTSPWEWHHIVLQVDTTQAVAKDRVVLWVDGVKYNEKYSVINEQPTQNLDTRVNNTGEPFYLFYNVNADNYSYNYLADVYFLDGSSQPATAFGEFKDGYWKPKNPGSLSYGTNGFYLNFADTSNPGKDISGKGNDFTASNFLSNYITKDSPTNKLAVLDYFASDLTYITEGGISFDRSADNRGWSSTMLVDSGKWYCEITFEKAGTGLVGVGSINYEWNTELGLKDGEIGWYQPDGTLRINNTTGNLYGYSFSDGDVVGIALDMNNNRVYFSLNGVWQRGGTPETVGQPAAAGLPSPCQIIASTHGTAQFKGTINYGQYDFKHQPPSLFLPLGDYYDYNISNSIRTSSSSDEGYLSKTFGSAGNRKKWTLSTWFKNNGPGSDTTIFGTPITLTTSGTAVSLKSTFGALSFTFIESSTTKYLDTLPEFRDAKWHHLVTVVDTTQSTESDRVRLYVDAKRITDFTTENYPSQNVDLDVNTTNLAHNIGSASTKTGLQVAETIFVDGHAMDPVFFGTYKDNMWVPLDYDTNYGVYGSNGFYLNYSNSSARGEDSSGNNNDFTVTAGSVVGLTDTPTTHFCVLNQESFYNDGSAKNFGTTKHNGLSWTNTSSTNFNGCYGTHGMWAGKYYWEVFTKDGDATNKGNWMAGLANTSNTQYVLKRSDGTIASFAEKSTTATWSSHGSAIGNSDTLCVAYDADSGKIWFGKNGTWFSSGNPATGANPAFTASAGGRPFVGDLGSSGTSYIGINFGQYSFNYTPPTGFVGVSYKNMTKPSNYGDYEGTTPYCLDGSKSGSDVIVYNDSKSITTVSGTAWKTILTNLPLPAINDYKFTDGLSYYYWEATLKGAGEVVVGIADASVNLDSFIGVDTHGWGYSSWDGKIYHNSVGSTYGDSCTTDDVIGVAVGIDSSNNVAKLLFSKNGVWQNSGTPAYTSLSGTLYPAFAVYRETAKLEINFGETPFKNEMPIAKPLACIKSTDNRDFHPFSASYLPATMAGYDYGFDLSLYTGNSTGEAKNIIDANFKADLVWIKNRTSGDDSNILFDYIRGWNREFRPDLGYESGVTEFHEALEQEGIQDVTANRIITSKQTARYNTNNEKHVAWYWKSDPDWGMEVISFLGDGTTPRQISHNLGKVPEFWFVRNRERDDAYWYVYHKDLDATIPQNKYLQLQTDAAAGDSTALWADTAPTSTYFTVGNHNSVNRSGNEIMFYLFTSIKGFSKMGFYIGNESVNGPFVYTGFRPAYIMTKAVGAAKDWRTFDVKRIGYNNKNYVLRCAVKTAEAAEDSVEIFSNGFKLTSTDTNSNRADTRHIYIAFAEQPIKYSNAR